MKITPFENLACWVEVKTFFQSHKERSLFSKLHMQAIREPKQPLLYTKNLMYLEKVEKLQLSKELMYLHESYALRF